MGQNPKSLAKLKADVTMAWISFLLANGNDKPAGFAADLEKKVVDFHANTFCKLAIESYLWRKYCRP